MESTLCSAWPDKVFNKLLVIISSSHILEYLYPKSQSLQPFPSPVGAFKSLDRDGTGQIQVNIQEVRTPVLGCGLLAGDPSSQLRIGLPSSYYPSNPWVRAEKGRLLFPGSLLLNLCAFLSPVAAADYVLLNGNTRPLPSSPCCRSHLGLFGHSQGRSRLQSCLRDSSAFPFFQSLTPSFSVNSQGPTCPNMSCPKLPLALRNSNTPLPHGSPHSLAHPSHTHSITLLMHLCQAQHLPCFHAPRAIL